MTTKALRLIAGLPGRMAPILADSFLAKGLRVARLLRRASSFNTGSSDHSDHDPRLLPVAARIMATQ